VPGLSRSHIGLLIGLGLVVVVLVGALGAAMKEKHRVEPLTQPVVVAAPTGLPPLPEVEAPVVPEVVAFTLKSEPPGAEVEVGGEKKGLTPLEVKVERARLPTLLTLSKDGFEAHQATLGADTGPSLTVMLKKRVAVVKPVGRPPNDIKTTR
jgi:eukaryotic-like serine/threonine-protein kinase